MPFVFFRSYITLLSFLIFFVWEGFFTRFFACVILNIYICIKFQEKEVAYCLFVRHETFGSRLIYCKTKNINILFNKIN